MSRVFARIHRIRPDKRLGLIPPANSRIDDALFQPGIQLDSQHGPDKDQMVRQHLAEVLLHGEPQRRAPLQFGAEHLRRKYWRVVLELGCRVANSQDGTEDEEEEDLTRVAATTAEELRRQDTVEALDQATARYVAGSTDVSGLDVFVAPPATVGEGCRQQEAAEIVHQAIRPGGFFLKLKPEQT